MEYSGLRRSQGLIDMTSSSIVRLRGVLIVLIRSFRAMVMGGSRPNPRILTFPMAIKPGESAGLIQMVRTLPSGETQIA